MAALLALTFYYLLYLLTLIFMFCSCSDDLCHGTLLSIVEMVPLKGFVAHIVSKLLNTSLRIMKDNDSAAAGLLCFKISIHIIYSILLHFEIFSLISPT